MNHYPHHVGDFNSATRHLTFVERALYRELLDLYYDTEQPLNADLTKLARRVLANTDELRAALQIVLEEFFVLQADGWHNARCDREIAAYHQKAEQQSRAGRASAAKRGGKDAGARAFDSGSTPASAVPQSTPQSDGTPVQRPFNARSTNQNQNQNQNQDTHQPPLTDQPAQPQQPDVGPDGPVRDGLAAAAVCMAMRAKGLASVNPASPELQALIDRGAGVDVFVNAAAVAVQKHKGFAYALGIVKGQLGDAAAMAGAAVLSAGPVPPAETPYQRSMRERVAELAPSVARAAPAVAVVGGNVIDVAARVLPVEVGSSMEARQ